MSSTLEHRADRSATSNRGLGKWSLVVAVNDLEVLRNTLLASPSIDSQCQVLCKSGFVNASKAYNSGFDEALHDIVAFVHQDVFLPDTWTANVAAAISHLSTVDPDWGVLGVFGITAGSKPVTTGYCYSTGLKSIIGGPFALPIKAQSLDELVLIIRRSSGLRFDEALPGFHLYGADLCAAAEAAGMTNYIVPAFCIHNSNGLKALPASFWQAYLYLRKKWWERLPLVTCCTSVTRGCIPMLRQIFADFRHRFSSPQVGIRTADVTALYRQLSNSAQL